MNRVVFLIDGFNLYHSIRDLYKYEKLRAKWLNIYSFCSSFLYLISEDANVSEIYYFSAFAHHLDDPDAVKRHRDYIECLKFTGINVEMGKFKPKEITCPLYKEILESDPNIINCKCKGKITKHEEKATDVAMATRLFEVLLRDKCDTVVLLTGDTDLVPAIKVCKELFPKKNILFAFPYRRSNSELEELSPNSFKIHAKTYIKHVFPAIVHLPDGRVIQKPQGW